MNFSALVLTKRSEKNGLSCPYFQQIVRFYPRKASFRDLSVWRCRKNCDSLKILSSKSGIILRGNSAVAIDLVDPY